jgi:putative transposase
VQRLPTPEETESCSVPAYQRIRLHNCQSARPGKESAQHHPGEFRCGSWTAPAGLALQVESQLPSEKQILGDHGGPGTKYHTDKVPNDGKRQREGPNHSALLQEHGRDRSISNTLLQCPPSRESNFSGAQVSIDFFTVPTVSMRVLFVFFVLEHRRREVLHFNVTEHPTAVWTSQQIVEAFADRDAPQYLIRDRDRIYGNEVVLRIASLRIEEILTAPRSPWQNPYAERLIGSIRTDCLNHFVIMGAKHLKRTLASYFAYYHGSRTHLGLNKQYPFPRRVSSTGRIIEIPLLGGLHHRYERVAA